MRRGYHDQTEEGNTEEDRREIQTFIAVDEELGCGFAPAGFYDELYERIYALETQLAKLSHYESVEEMMADVRGCGGEAELPFL